MIATRQQLIDYCLRKLGAPVIAIEIEESQIDDRIDDAIQFFQAFHYDATEKTYISHKVVGTKINTTSTSGFLVGEKCITTSNKNFTIKEILSDGFIVYDVYNNTGEQATISLNETITGQTSNNTTTFVSKISGDTELKSISLDDSVVGVTKILPLTSVFLGANAIFDPKYQLITNSFQSLGNSSMIYYEQLGQYIDLIDQVLRPVDSVRFNRKMGRVYLDIDWSTVPIGSYIVVDCFKTLDPELYVKIYNDMMLKDLCVAYLKKQWAQNTGKYQNIQLLGGVSVDSTTLMAQSEAEISQIKDEIHSRYEMPPIGFLG